MRYLKYSEDRGWDFDEYFEYLKENRARIPAEIYEYFSNVKNYDMTSHQSLHDAWLEDLSIREQASGSRRENRVINIDLNFLGAYHDKKINLKYSGVSLYNLSVKANSYGETLPNVGHGDLIVHELTVLAGNCFCHEMLFAGGNTLSIEFASFSHSVSEFDK